MKLSFIDKILLEAIDTEHVVNRIKARFLSNVPLNVGFEASPMQYKVVGTYSIPQPIQDIIKENIELVQSFNFPDKKTYGVKIVQINIDKNKVDYVSEEAKNAAKMQTLVFTNIENSNGNVIYAVIRKNIFVTAFYGKSYVKNDEAKMGVDWVFQNFKSSLAKGNIR